MTFERGLNFVRRHFQSGKTMTALNGAVKADSFFFYGGVKNPSRLLFPFHGRDISRQNSRDVTLITHSNLEPGGKKGRRLRQTPVLKLVSCRRWLPRTAPLRSEEFPFWTAATARLDPDTGRSTERRRRPAMGNSGLRALLFLLHTIAQTMAEQEVENLSGLSTNPEKDIFVVRENGTTCLMAEFAAKFIVPYDVWASNFVDLITEQADIPLSRGAEMKGRCGHNESELQIFWVDKAYALKLLFVKEVHNTSTGQEASWRLSKVQFVYDTSERTYFKDAVNPGKHTANSRRLSALVTPAGRSYECQAQQTISLTSSDHQKTVAMLLSAVHIQPFDIISDFVFSEEHKCPVDEREQLEETLPLILGLILGLVIVLTIAVYHIHHKMTANQVQIPRDRSQYKHMG
ncbi:lysosome-associated membrane glycoprotein 5 [Tachyglossus aculeatus]|uniref:lysosome-associated membrane glycoprotein 5 n=1 Tax=Tachyglossus aculeatus TaxID=9261 RepID=UPI0018F43D85|nr:lysosome-associated membrane glycoprotein 5 [Tachyglossus aculeatus]